MTRLRTAGARWRVLVHERGGERRAHDITSDPGAPARHAKVLADLGILSAGGKPAADLTVHHVIEGAEFDELVVGRFLWAEQMDTGLWTVDVGGVRIDVRADRDGRPVRVTVHAPEGEWPRCEYVLDW